MKTKPVSYGGVVCSGMRNPGQAGDHHESSQWNHEAGDKRREKTQKDLEPNDEPRRPESEQCRIIRLCRGITCRNGQREAEEDHDENEYRQEFLYKEFPS